MLKFLHGSKYNTDNSYRKWIVESTDLRKQGIRSPQGFTFELSEWEDISNFFWTTNEFAAFLFYKRYKLASPEVQLYFKEAMEKCDRLYDLSYATESQEEFPAPKGVAFYPYQNAGIRYCLEADNVLIADSMRIGKTATTIGVINTTDWINKILIVCPKTAKLVWIKELQTFLTKDLKVQVLNAQSVIDPTADIYILNYDNLAVHSKLAKVDFDLIIADEVHAVKNQKAQRSKFLFALKAKKKIGLSGTPLLNKPKDLLTVLQWIDPFWQTFRVYKGNFANKAGITLTLEEVQELIRASCLLRRVQPQVFTTEPIERRIIPLEVPANLVGHIEVEKQSYKKYWRLNDYTRARKLIGLGKVQPAIEYISTYTSEEDDKIVCFAWHKEVIDRISASLGTKAEKLYGDTNDAQRAAVIDRFNNDDTCQVIIGSIPAMSMAINLSVTNHIVFIEQDYSEGLVEQAEERCSDKNQKEQVLVEYLCFDESLDYHMSNIRMGKEHTTDRALNVIY